jgi:hypothetical protein
MKFKQFLKINEDGANPDNGMMGFPKMSSIRKPSDGQPFKNLSSVAGQEPRGGGGGGGAVPQGGAMYMKKKMKKH